MNVATPLPFSGALRDAPPSTLNDAFPVGVPDTAETVTCTTPAAGYVTVGALMLQVALGAAFRHNLLGVLWHILCAFVVVIFGLGMTVLITQVPENASLRAPVIWLASLLGVQVSLGMVLISISDPAKHALFSDISVASHVTIGASCLGLGVLLSMLIRRAAQVAPAEVPVEG